jgi:hypothetical protein
VSLFGLKIYTVHVKPGETLAHEKPVFVREGFNILAFALTGFWALYQRLWVHGLLIILFNGILMLLNQEQVLSQTGMTIIQLGFNLLIGFHANDWRRVGLTRRGYIVADIVTGDSLLRAEQRYFERHLAHA